MRYFGWIFVFFVIAFIAVPVTAQESNDESEEEVGQLGFGGVVMFESQSSVAPAIMYDLSDTFTAQGHIDFFSAGNVMSAEILHRWTREPDENESVWFEPIAGGGIWRFSFASSSFAASVGESASVHALSVVGGAFMHLANHPKVRIKGTLGVLSGIGEETSGTITILSLGAVYFPSF